VSARFRKTGETVRSELPSVWNHPVGGTFRQRRLFADAALEVRIGPPEPLCKATRDPLDFATQRLVDNQRQPRGSRNQLNGPVVVSRAQAARNDAEIRAQSLGKRRPELGLFVADDRDQRRLEPEPYELAREERHVAIGPVAADQLAARDDDDAT